MSVLVLVFTVGGQAVLEEDTEVVWASDDDDDWRDAHGNEFLDADDAEDVLTFLIEEGVLEEDEAPHISIEVEDALTEEEVNEERTLSGQARH